MNRCLIATPMLGLALLALAAGCTVQERVVTRTRPVDRVEVVPAQPSPRHAWVRGRWESRGERWEWIEGRWEIH